MSVRKISELPYIDIRDKSLSGNILNSLLEISYSNNDSREQAFWFTSKYVRYGEMVSSIIEQIGGRETETKVFNFWNNVDFSKRVYMYNSLELSGNFYMNKDAPDSDLANYEILLRSNKNTFYAISENILSSPTTSVYSNNINFNSYDGMNPIAKFNTNDINFYKPTTINGNLTVTGSTKLTDLSCRNMKVTGVAYFDKDIHGCALRARWADLAEGYESDAEYEPGTFVRFGGEKEITIASEYEANAVITTQPGFILGADGRKGIIQNIALVGRTPVKVIGPVSKFDRLVMSEYPGIAEVQKKQDGRVVVARALESSEKTGIVLVESVVQLKL